MPFENDVVAPLSRLAAKLIERRAFRQLEAVAHLLNGLDSRQWQSLPDDERAHWLDTVVQLLGPFGLDRDGVWSDDEDHRQALAHLDAERKTLAQRLCA
jgi:hypothetical protein